MENNVDYTVSNGYSEQEAPRTQEVRKKPRRKAGGLIALALVCALLGGLVGAGAVTVGNRVSGKAGGGVSAVQVSNRRPTVLQTVQTEMPGSPMTLADLYERSVGSTVGIHTAITVSQWGYTSKAAAAGSGFILTGDGYILTNYHVVEKADGVMVALYDGRSFEAVVVGGDRDNDIAVLKIDAAGLKPVVLGNSDAVRVGDTVAAIGNPLGELTFSLTHGCISALSRRVTFSDGLSMNLMQTDCAINSGNSGGALFNLYGEVIGITNAKYSGNGSSGEASIDNIGFAIPINQVREIVSSIIETGVVKKAYIGVTVQNVSADAQKYGLPAGASVVEVTEGGPADAAGLQVNDIITSANGEAVASSDDLVAVIGRCVKGDKLTLTVYRMGEAVTLTVTVGERVTSALPEKETVAEEETDPFEDVDPWGSYFPWDFFFGY